MSAAIVSGYWLEIDKHISPDFLTISIEQKARHSKVEKRGDLVLKAQKLLKLANNAHFLYVMQNSTEKAKLLKMLCWNSSVDGANISPTCGYPFDAIFKRAKTSEWSGSGSI
jgi:hypothetical protein